MVTKDIAIYQTQKGSIEVKIDNKGDTILLTQSQVGQLFNVQKAAISKHVKNIFDTKELGKNSTVSKMETVQNEGGRKIIRKIEYYNLDLIISIGYRVNSNQATKFRQWATKILSQHIVDGFTINKKRIQKNYVSFLKTVESIKKLLPDQKLFKAEDVLELITAFSSTWFSLDSYDKKSLPTKGITQKQADFTIEQFQKAFTDFKTVLLSKSEASDLFGMERNRGNFAGIIGNIFQSFADQDLYPTIEEKAAHLLYFIVKNHPFADGNKRSGAYMFVWFLRQTKRLDLRKISPQALTTLTLLIAQSPPSDKNQTIGLILLLLN